MPRIKAGDLTLNYVEAGTGDAFLFIPGLMGLLEAWAFQLPHFSKRYRCIAFDHRGSGESDKPTDAYSTHLIARDAVGLLDALGIARAHVAGTSTGAACSRTWRWTLPTGCAAASSPTRGPGRTPT